MVNYLLLMIMISAGLLGAIWAPFGVFYIYERVQLRRTLRLRAGKQDKAYEEKIRICNVVVPMLNEIYTRLEYLEQEKRKCTARSKRKLK